ncbi:CLUMA_CG019804, isoform A [Clunio marinus]|uniref:CLUMA_CG019804, isoform A n=1 Tax=Clunio marinus TaxID=568069 RepID=A0A1J1J3L6_9DIPT|nr:CLUMA_CG019804, isoform A [Clunio marinus]
MPNEKAFFVTYLKQKSFNFPTLRPQMHFSYNKNSQIFSSSCYSLSFSFERADKNEFNPISGLGLINSRDPHVLFATGNGIKKERNFQNNKEKVRLGSREEQMNCKFTTQMSRKKIFPASSTDFFYNCLFSAIETSRSQCSQSRSPLLYPIT